MRIRIEREFGPDVVRQLKDDARHDITVNGPGLAAHALRAGLVVLQWVQDCLASPYSRLPTDGSPFENYVEGTQSCSYRVLRGGNWGDPPQQTTGSCSVRQKPFENIRRKSYQFTIRLSE